LIAEWRKEPGLYNSKYITDLMQNTVQNECASELKTIVEAHRDE